MHNLILKDILIQKKMIITALLYTVFMMFTFQSMDGAKFTIIVTAVTYLFVMSACAYDDKNKSDIMLNSLPISRKKVVLSRYMSLFVFAAISMTVYIVISGVIKLAHIPLKVNTISIEDIVGSITSLVIVASLYFPVFFKVGYIKSKMLNFIIFFSMFFGVSLLIGFFKEHKLNNTAITNLIKYISTQSDITIVLSLILIMLLVLSISYSLSLKFYKNREF